MTYKGVSHQLTVRQTEILQLLSENQGRIVDRDNILRSIWGNDSYANSMALNVQITYLRRLLEDPAVSITSIKKKGYILSAESKSVF